MIVFISGKVKSGKSMFGQCLSEALKKDGRLFYLATMIPYDREDEKRIKRHISDRKDFDFTTLEEGFDIEKILSLATNKDTVLLDSLTSLVSNFMFGENRRKKEEIHEIICEKLQKIAENTGNFIVISDDIFFSGEEISSSVTEYMKTLGKLHVSFSKNADMVIEAIASSFLIRKGEKNNEFLRAEDMFYSLSRHLYYGVLK